MTIFKTIFRLESKKILIRGNIIFFIVIAMVLIVLVTENIDKYQTMLKNKKEFQEMQLERMQQYMYYDQYAAFGIKILFIPPPYIIMLSDFTQDEITASVNIGDRLSISMPLEKGFVIENNGFLYFAGIVLLSAVVFGLLSGYFMTKNPDYSRLLYRLNSGRSTFFQSTAANLILLNAAFLSLLALCLLWLFFQGINLFNAYILVYILEFALISALFFFVGTLVGDLDKNKYPRSIILAILIAAFVFLIPWLSIKINRVINSDIEKFSRLEKINFKILMTAETKIAQEIGIYKNNGQKAPENVLTIVEREKNTTFKQIRENLEKRKRQILEKIKADQILLSLFPVTFALSINNEISGCGGTNYIDYFTHCLNVKEEFKNYILEKKFKEGAVPDKVESFIKPGDELNIFYAKSRLPYSFPLGIIVALILISGLMILSSVKYRRRCRESKDSIVPISEEFKDNPVFILCKNSTIKNGIYNYFETKDRCACLDKIDTDDFQFKGLNAGNMLTHLCQLSGVDEKKARERLALMEIRDIGVFELSHEITLKIVAAIETASDFDVLIMNDFLENEPRKFESDIFSLLSALKKEGKKIIYLSCQMKQGSTPSIGKIKLDRHISFSLDLDISSVR